MDRPHRRRTIIVLLAALMSLLGGASTVFAGGAISTNRIGTQPAFARPMLPAQPPHTSLRDKNTKPAANSAPALSGIAGESQDDTPKNKVRINSW